MTIKLNQHLSTTKTTFSLHKGRIYCRVTVLDLILAGGPNKLATECIYTARQKHWTLDNIAKPLVMFIHNVFLRLALTFLNFSQYVHMARTVWLKLGKDHGYGKLTMVEAWLWLGN